MSILPRSSNLKELHLDGSELADPNLAAELRDLKRLGLRDYYIMDLGPPEQTEFLEYPDTRDSPVGEMGDVGNGVEIIQ